MLHFAARQDIILWGGVIIQPHMKDGSQTKIPNENPEKLDFVIGIPSSES